jgi:hypothetical protein
MDGANEAKPLHTRRQVPNLIHDKGCGVSRIRDVTAPRNNTPQ